jgi:membrane dipeptidase
MADGDMDVAFLIVYTGQGPLTPEGYANAYRQAVDKFEAIHRLTTTIAPDAIGLAPARPMSCASTGPEARRQ